MRSSLILCFIFSVFAPNIIFSQQNNSFNFQTSGANEDFVTITSNAQLHPSAGMTLAASSTVGIKKSLKKIYTGNKIAAKAVGADVAKKLLD